MKLERLRVEAAACNRIGMLATDDAKRELFARLSRRLLAMTAEVEALIGGSAGDREE